MDVPVKIRYLGQRDYLSTWHAMQRFTEERTLKTQDELWILEHNPVYTLGQRNILNDLVKPTSITVIPTDRGGRITYHGPGQLLIYPLFNLKRLQCDLRQLVSALENTVIQLLADYRINAYANPKAPGVYVNEAKIAALGIRIRKGCCYHGLAINIDMDLSPFKAIRPCGFDIQTTQLSALIPVHQIDKQQIATQLCHYFQTILPQ